MHLSASNCVSVSGTALSTGDPVVCKMAWHGLCCRGAHSLVTAHISFPSKTTFSQFGYSKIIQEETQQSLFHSFLVIILYKLPSPMDFFPYKQPLNLQCPLHSSCLESKLRDSPSHSKTFSLVSLFLFQSIWQPAPKLNSLNHYVQSPSPDGLDNTLFNTEDGSLFFHIHMLPVKTSYYLLAP